MTDFFAAYDDPRWWKRRDEIFAAKGRACCWCGVQHGRIEVHHGYYLKDRKPWEYSDAALWPLCRACHDQAGFRMGKLRQILGELHPGKYTEAGRLLESLRRGRPAESPDWSQAWNPGDPREPTQEDLEKRHLESLRALRDQGDEAC